MGTTLKQSHSSLTIRRSSSSPRISAKPIETRRPSTDPNCNVIIKVDGISFALEKASICARSRRIKQLVDEHKEPWPFCIEFPNLPGGADALSLVAKFFRGIDIEINASNVAVMHYIATYLEMTEELGIDNLIPTIESYLRATVFRNLKQCVQVLFSCQSILLQADVLELTRRCIDAIASIICGSCIENGKGRMLGRQKPGLAPTSTPRVNWWTDDLITLPIDFFKQTIDAMTLKGLREASIADALIHYAHQALKPFPFKSLRTFICNQEEQGQVVLCEHEQRIALETIVNLLPWEKGVVPVSFLFDLLRAGYLLDSTMACRMELEKRISAELEHATLEEILIPFSPAHSGDTHFDVDFAHRLVVNFVQQNTINDTLLSSNLLHNLDAVNSPLQVAVRKVAKLLDSYLAEVAADPNLKVTKFFNLLELLPNHACALDDGKYRAIDIYLKAHPTISEEDRRRTCKSMDCQRLSQEARFHAAQNERLPVQVRVQVLYLEQLRLHRALSSLCGNGEAPHAHYTSQRLGVCSASRIPSSSEQHYASLKQENEDLKKEIAVMRTRLSYLENQGASSMPPAMQKPSSVTRLLSSVSRTFQRIKPFTRGSMMENAKPQERRYRRHSMS